MAEKENKFFVLTKKDIQKYLTVVDMRLLKSFVQKIVYGRESEGKGMNDYITCNQDEPYADLVWQIILLGEDAKHNNNETIK